MKMVEFKPIGVIRSPFKEPRGTPIQPTASGTTTDGGPSAGKGIEGRVEVFPEFAEGLKDIDGFSHIILLFHFHLAREPKLLATPFMDDEPRGIFAIRGPSRPNPIGMSIVRLDRVEGNILHVRDMDIVDGTPLLDIKPYVPMFDERDEVKVGWLEGKRPELAEKKDDGRFS